MAENTNTTDLAQRLDEVLADGASTPVADSCSNGTCSTGASSAGIDPRPCPKCGKHTNYRYNITHLPPGRSHWPGCLCG